MILLYYTRFPKKTQSITNEMKAGSVDVDIQENVVHPGCTDSSLPTSSFHTCFCVRCPSASVIQFGIQCLTLTLARGSDSCTWHTDTKLTP